MKRLLCIMNVMEAGGAETFLMKLYRAIDKSQYQFDFCVTVNEPAFYDEEIQRLGGKIHRITQKTKNLRQFRKDLYDVVKNNHYDYVLRISANCMGFMDLKLAKQAGAKVCVARSSNSDSGSSFLSKILHRMGRVLYGRYVDVKIAPSDLAAIYTFGASAYKQNQVIILNNGIDLDVYQYNGLERRRIREEFGIPQDALVFGHIGRFTEQKNHSYLIKVFHEIHKKIPNAFFLIMGKGEKKNSIIQQVGGLGLTDCTIISDVRSDVPSVLSALDVFIMPSLYEGMPNTIIEAQAAGLPCVLSDTITKTADLTGLVHYHALSEDTGVWADTAIRLAKKERTDTREKMKESGYDIKDVSRKFISAVFGA